MLVSLFASSILVITSESRLAPVGGSVGPMRPTGPLLRAGITLLRTAAWKANERTKSMLSSLPVKKRLLALSVACIASMNAALAATDAQVVTLYRNSRALPDARIHVATFDSTTRVFGGTTLNYNAENCEVAASLFKSQEGVNPKMRYWCELGRFRPKVAEKIE